MTEQHTPRPLLLPEKKRTRRISVTVSPEQKLRIEDFARQCGMTPSTYLMTLGCRYEPKARLTDEQTQMLSELISARSDVINYSNALHAMPQEERKRFFRQYAFMLKWLQTLSVMEQRITLFLDKVNVPNIIPDRKQSAYTKQQQP